MKHPNVDLKNPYYFFSTKTQEGEDNVLYEISNEQDKDGCGKHLVTYLTDDREVKSGQSYLNKHGDRVQVTEDGTYPVKNDYINTNECAKTFPWIKVSYQESLEDYIVISDSDSKFKRNNATYSIPNDEDETEPAQYYAWEFGGRTVLTVESNPGKGDDVYNIKGVCTGIKVEKFVTADSTTNEEYLWLDYLIQDDDKFTGNLDTTNDEVLGHFVINPSHIDEEGFEGGYVEYYRALVIEEYANLLLNLTKEEAQRSFPDFLFAVANDLIKLNGKSVYFLNCTANDANFEEQIFETITDEEVNEAYYTHCCELIQSYAERLANKVGGNITDIQCLNQA